MSLAGFIRALVLAGMLVPGGAPLADPVAAPSPALQAPRRDPAKLTLKERSGGKAGDEQRVDDCKVPPDRRGDSRRPADCAAR